VALDAGARASEIDAVVHAMVLSGDIRRERAIKALAALRTAAAPSNAGDRVGARLDAPLSKNGSNT
jgi:hypothetical protein